MINKQNIKKNTYRHLSLFYQQFSPYLIKSFENNIINHKKTRGNDRVHYEYVRFDMPFYANVIFAVRNTFVNVKSGKKR